MSSRLSFVSSTGVTFPLDGSDGIQCVNLVEGLATIPTDLLIDQRVAADGGTISNERRGPRRLMLDFMIADSDKLDVLAKWAQLQAALAAGGKLVFDGSNGLRELRDVVLESATREVVGPDRIDDVFAASLIALDPYWYGPIVETLIPFAADTAWNAAIPWNSEIPWNGGGSVIVTVTGDVPAFPIFVAQGALSTVLVALGGDETVFWMVDTALPNTGPNAAVTVDHRPGYRGPRYGADLIPGFTRGDVNWALISEDSRVTWSLPLGQADIVVGVTGDDVNARLTLFYEPRWLTP